MVSASGHSEQRLDDLLGSRWAVVRSAGPGALVVEGVPWEPRETLPLREHGEISLSAWLERNDADAVLVRPDRYIFGLAARHDPGSFEALLADAARYVGVVPAVL